MPTKPIPTSDLPSAIKKVVKRKPASTPMPTLVDNSHLNDVNEMFNFSAGKARAVVDRLSDKTALELHNALHQIKELSERGVSKRVLSKEFSAEVLLALTKLGYKIEPLVTSPVKKTWYERWRDLLGKSEPTVSNLEHSISW
jgi:DNA-binding HxlR family transcriptional regulator